MIYCKSCGTEYEDFASFCNACELPLVDEAGKSLEEDPVEVARSATEELQKIKQETASVHKILGWIYVALFTVGLVFAFINGAGYIRDYLFLLILLVPAAIHVFAANGLERNKAWGRPLSIIIGVLLLPGFPIGTFLGSYILLQMFRKQWKLAAALS